MNLKTTLIPYDDNLLAIHLGSSEFPINNTSCQKAKLKFTRRHCSKPGLEPCKFLQANEILGKRGKLTEFGYKVNTYKLTNLLRKVSLSPAII